MTAVETAQQILAWSAGGTGPIPGGDLRFAEELAVPPEPVRDAARNVATVTAARLRLGTPPLGDVRPMGVGVVLLAAACGAADHEQIKLARYLLDAVPVSDVATDCLARYGLLATAEKCLPDALAEECRLLSPLTMVLQCPLKSQVSKTIAFSRRMLGQPDGRALLLFHFACPANNLCVRQWRTDFLERLRTGDAEDQRFVLDVYESAMIHHREQVMRQIRVCRAVVLGQLASRDKQLLEEALSVADWWGPLWNLHRENPDALRRRPYLHYDFLEGLKLYRLRQLMMGGAA